jgi:hydrogenase maturation protease
MTDDKIILLAAGNDILGDEGIALIIGRKLHSEFSKRIDFVQISDTGMELLEIFDGYRKALILTPISTNINPIGHVEEINIKEFNNSADSSLHYVNFSQLFNLSASLNIPLPETIKTITIEVKKDFRITEEMSSDMKESFPETFKKVHGFLEELMFHV